MHAKYEVGSISYGRQTTKKLDASKFPSGGIKNRNSPYIRKTICQLNLDWNSDKYIEYYYAIRRMSWLAWRDESIQYSVNGSCRYSWSLTASYKIQKSSNVISEISENSCT